jgi:beta-glucosidase
VRYFEHGKQGKPVETTNGHKEAAFSPVGDMNAKFKDIQFTTTFVPSESGSHYLGCSGIGPTRVSINDQVVFDQKTDCEDAMGFLLGGLHEDEFHYSFTKGVSYQIQIQTSPPDGKDTHGGILEGLPGFRLGFMNKNDHDEDLLSEAVQVARECDYAIVFTGHTPVWETEGQDQLSFNLPKDGSQDRLVDAVASANSKTIVVNSTGVAIAMPWLPKVSAVLQAWFPGQEAGNAIADVISGAVNPSGRLPISWPKRIEDAPAYGNFPGTKKDGQLTVKYEEGVFVGYRHYDRLSQDKVQFPFGFGLSYTTFDLNDATVSQNEEGVFTTSINVVNTGNQAGATVVQLYIGRTLQSPEHPIKTLAAFEKVFLEPGQGQRVELRVGLKDFAYFDETSGTWKVEKGRYEFWFGQSTQHVEDVVGVDVQDPKGSML